MPRTRNMGAAMSSPQPQATRVRSESVASSTSTSSSVTSNHSSKSLFDGGGIDTATTPDHDAIDGPAYNTRRAKRARQDTPESPTRVRRSKRRSAHPAISAPRGDARRSCREPISPHHEESDSKPGHVPTRASTPDLPDLADKAPVTGEHDGDTSSTLSSPPSSLASERTNRSASHTSHTSTSTQSNRESPGDIQRACAESKYTIINDLKRHLGQFATGEIAYGRKLAVEPSPQITVKGVGSLKLPLSEDQLITIRNCAQQPFAGKFGSDWPFNSAHRLTSIIPDDGFEITNAAEWTGHVSSLISDVATYLGFGARATSIQSLPRSVFLWEKGNIWRGYTKPHEEHKHNWIGTVLLILDQECEGGEIAARYRNKDILFEHATRGRFLIASHAGTWLDVMPLTRGYRLGLTYELYLADNPLKHTFLDRLVTINKRSDSALVKDLCNWIGQIYRAEMTNFPLIQVLDGAYEQQHMNIYSVNAEDRSLILRVLKVTHDKQVTPQHGRSLQAYLVFLKATSKNYSTGNRVRYSLEWAATIEGHTCPDVKEILIDPQGVLQKDKFGCGDKTRQVSRTMSTTTKSLPCLMLTWDERS
ncbi:hypothetical protein QBC37DRAFT_162848 [Rhypophila decipiens]|uniref:Uncharacterized protein n=1 Tax=Rhypophila decipiens TaxID=261697 RepID=A0AAN6Y9J0_9PEZI|nr:hypothetical protein QBC37DRAFT_162848 [Rhypophila decipiens]